MKKILVLILLVVLISSCGTPPSEVVTPEVEAVVEETFTVTPTVTLTVTETPEPTPTFTATFTVTPTVTETPEPTSTFTPTPTWEYTELIAPKVKSASGSVLFDYEKIVELFSLMDSLMQVNTVVSGDCKHDPAYIPLVDLEDIAGSEVRCFDFSAIVSYCDPREGYCTKGLVFAMGDPEGFRVGGNSSGNYNNIFVGYTESLRDMTLSNYEHLWYLVVYLPEDFDYAARLRVELGIYTRSFDW